MKGEVSAKLSRAASSLWAKSDYGRGQRWLPLFIHSFDAAAMGLFLWNRWLPRGTKEAIARVLDGDELLACRLVVFLCAVHDIGKATPIFQAKDYWDAVEGSGLSWIPERAGLSVAAGLQTRRPSHPIAGEMLLQRYLLEMGLPRRSARAIGAVVGAHHGNPPRDVDLNEEAKSRRGLGRTYDGAGGWESAQRELIELARIFSEFNDEDLSRVGCYVLNAPVANLVTGIVIMADWLASNECLFSLINPVGYFGGFIRGGSVDLDALLLRADRAWRSARIIPAWQEPVDCVVDIPSFPSRFSLPEGAKIRPVQRRAIEAAQSMEGSGLLIIEAPMGEGKTEAALAAAEIMAQRTGRGGVCVALPTMATTDAMFNRVHAWVNRLPQCGQDQESMYLAHGKARLNEEYRGLVQKGEDKPLVEMGVDISNEKGMGSERATVTSWMQGRKKGMLANFVVCTVDQVLMAALQMKHLSLRHLALDNKVVIIDECHAYDAYMQEYLSRALEWLASAQTPVILLSATLPPKIRKGLMDAYRDGISASPANAGSGSLLAAIPQSGGRRGRLASVAAATKSADEGRPENPSLYPVINVVTASRTWTIPAERSARSAHVDLHLIGDDVEELVRILTERLREGGCAGVICDTVTRAQEVLNALCESFQKDELILVHARFTDIDRMENEERLRRLLGPDATLRNGGRPHRLVVVGTQVLEQSLDIDFDVLATDIAPIDLVLQRLGRVHRHARGVDQADRPEALRRPVCLVRGVVRTEEGPEFDKGVRTVYEPAALMEALSVLGVKVAGASAPVKLPDDIAPMVQTAYGLGAHGQIPEEWRDAYQRASDARESHLAEKRRKANAYLVNSAAKLIKGNDSLIGLFSRNADADARSSHRDDDFGPRAVRDTQETVEVILLERRDGGLHLLPWVGAAEAGVKCGAEVPISYEPDEALASMMAQCAVRLPLAMSDPSGVDALIDKLEDICAPFVGAWQDSGWIAGKLFLPLENTGRALEVAVGDWTVSYTREMGLSTACR